MYIRRAEPTSPASEVLRQGTILMSFEGVDIANDGTVPFRSGERIMFSYLISQKYTDETVCARVPLVSLFPLNPKRPPDAELKAHARATCHAACWTVAYTPQQNVPVRWTIPLLCMYFKPALICR